MKTHRNSVISPAAVIATGLSVFLVSSATAENRTLKLSDSERVAIFDEAGTFTFKAPANVTGTAQILVVGGGGAGGGISGGGGGGGQVVAAEGIELTPGADYEVTVAAGGNGGRDSGGNGETSSFLSYTALGGGGGAGGWSMRAGSNGANGGAAGGNSSNTEFPGGQPTVEGGHAGARATTIWNIGGGGGAAEDGHDFEASEYPRCGGAGIVSDITGESLMYGAGGGASGGTSGGSHDEWGNGCPSNGTPTPGRPGSGGGGGGGLQNNGSAVGGAGGTGTVIIRYAVDRSQLTVDFAVDSQTGILPFETVFTATVDQPTGSTATLTWDFGDGSAPLETDSLSVNHTYAVPGVFTVSLSVSAAGQTVKKTVANCVTVANRDIYVDAASENELSPYATPETAAKTVTDALAAVVTVGQRILVKPGTYRTERPIRISADVEVLGLGATPGEVVFEQPLPNKWYASEDDMTRNIFTLNHARARVSNVTMRKGWHRMVSANPSAGGVIICAAGGTVSNCVISACVNARCNHGAAGADLAGGLITHSIIEDCEIDNPNLQYTPQHGGAVAMRLTGNARAENCLVRNCNKGEKSDEFHTVLINGSGAKAVNLTVVSCGSNPFSYQNSGSEKTPSYGLNVVDGEAINCVVADVCETGEGGVSRAWGGKAAGFVNCATDTAEKINDSCVTISTAAFKDFAAGDYRPKTNGALMNAGALVEGFTEETLDLAGGKRLRGRSLDIGCYEGLPAGLAVVIR